MPDTFVQDILDPEEIEKRAAWNKRMDLPVLVSLDNYFQDNKTQQSLLSGEFIHKINPESFLEDTLVSQSPVRYLANVDENILKLIENLDNLDHFYPVICLLIDGTGHRNNLLDNVFPPEEFILNRKKYSDIDLMLSHIKALINIPLGKNGIGVKNQNQDFGFSEINPFYIFVCAYNDSELRQYMDESLKITKDFPENLLKVVGFLAPKVG